MPRGRPQASCLRQLESYLKDMGMAGVASAWAIENYIFFVEFRNEIIFLYNFAPFRNFELPNSGGTQYLSTVRPSYMSTRITRMCNSQASALYNR